MRSSKNFLLVILGCFMGFATAVLVEAEGSTSTSGDLDKTLKRFAAVYSKIQSDYVETVSDEALFNGAMRGMLNELDPHSAYLDEQAYKELNEGTTGEFGGLGIEVEMADGLVKVISPIEDTPASRAGMMSGDLIEKVDGAPIKGKSLGDAVTLMRGKPGTRVELSVLRNGLGQPMVVKLVREVINTVSVKSSMPSPGYGYVRISRFQERTIEELVKATSNLIAQNAGTPLKGLVLDLRNDPGGLLNSAVGVSAAFLQPKDLIVYTEGRKTESKSKYRATRIDYAAYGDDPLESLPPSVKQTPLVVLINGGSASASEIVAGALQDHKRAVVLGTRSFGKGSVQSVVPLSENSAIKLTTSRYFTPNGRSIQAKGITPDIEVQDPYMALYDKLYGVREADLNGHLTEKRGEVVKEGAKSKSTEETLKLEQALKAAKPTQFGSEEDVQLGKAIDTLKAMSANNG